MIVDGRVLSWALINRLKRIARRATSGGREFPGEPCKTLTPFESPGPQVGA